jgi:tRNA nucleotidyltransferase (CCA-adding enzyme)
METVLKKVLAKITPTDGEHKLEGKLISGIIEKLRTYKVSPILVGSNAKGTDLRGDKDIDIFIRFPVNTSRKRLEERGLEIGKSLFKALRAPCEVDYAEHPYVKGVYRGYRIEIVPCFMGKDILSSVDRTPFHTEYVKKKIKARPGLSGEIRLLKQFMKAAGVYGAEAKVQGFSGYLVELLVIHYGSFERVLSAAQQWRPGKTIDPEKQWDDPKSLRHFFTNAALIVVDPVDRDRNVAAAVSAEKLAEFSAATKDFLLAPSERKFFPQKKKVKTKAELEKKLGERKTKLVAVTFKHEKINENSLYSQIRKAVESLKARICGQEFVVFRTGFWTNEKDFSIALIELEIYELPAVMHHPGPPISMDVVHQERFKEKYRHEKPYIKDGRWVVDTKRKYMMIEDLMLGVVREKSGFGKDLSRAKADVVYGKKIVSLGGKEFRQYLTEFL